VSPIRGEPSALDELEWIKIGVPDSTTGDKATVEKLVRFREEHCDRLRKARRQNIVVMQSPGMIAGINFHTRSGFGFCVILSLGRLCLGRCVAVSRFRRSTVNTDLLMAL
jgi:hypothetical protein